MASILRQIVAGPRSRHPEAGLDLCYVTDNIIATSGPSSTYPQRAYRNPTDALVKFLDYKHGANWAIWEFRAEGTGYPDSEVHGRVRHYPWPDHHPPPFALIPNIMASMRNWLKEETKDGKHVVVVHCKAGKGRSGTVATSYLISEEGWKVEDALARFTERRMRQGFGNGVSIPSQLRWVGYVDRWTKTQKRYVERPVEIVEVHAWGLREGVKVSVEGYVDEGRKIKVFHTFTKDERLVVDDSKVSDSVLARASGFDNSKNAPTSVEASQAASNPSLIDDSQVGAKPVKPERHGTESGGKAVIFRPKSKIVLPSSDVCLDLERRNRAKYGWTMVTAVAHVWFNVFFEGQGSELKVSEFQAKKAKEEAPEQTTNATTATAPLADREEANSTPSTVSSNVPTDTGVFEIAWDAMDGLKGSSRKGQRALDRVAIIWRAIGDEKPVPEPGLGEDVPESKPADWKGNDSDEVDPTHELGLRKESPSSADVSRASTVKPEEQEKKTEKEEEKEERKGKGNGKGSLDYQDSVKGVKTKLNDTDSGKIDK